MGAAGWAAVDGYIEERLLPADPGLERALAANAEAGLPAIVPDAFGAEPGLGTGQRVAGLPLDGLVLVAVLRGVVAGGVGAHPGWRAGGPD